MGEARYNDFIRASKESVEYWTETAITDFTEELCRRMDEQGVSRTELARRIDSSQAYVTKLLRGNVNFTLSTMTKLARALDTVVRVHLAPEGAIVKWEDYPAEQPTIIEFQQAPMEPRVSRNITARPSSGSAILRDQVATFAEASVR